jgi:cAMP-dependent protein kinase regulator
VESGELTCSKFLTPEDVQPTFLKTYHPGESFGELALLYNAPRAATIVCTSPQCELWSLERGTFNHIIKTAVQKKREKYDTFMEKVEILKCMDKNENSKIADAFKEEWFEDGDMIIRQGDKDENSSFYMIIEGQCVATMVMQPGTPAVEVKKYGPGDYFGERSLLKDAPRAANIIA